MPVIESPQVLKYEKQLLALKKYSFDNYSRLKLIFVNLKCLLDGDSALTNKQVQLDLVCEIDNEIQSLQDLRYSPDKEEEFQYHVNRGLAIVNRINQFVMLQKTAEYHEHVSFFSFIKKLFNSKLHHS